LQLNNNTHSTGIGYATIQMLARKGAKVRHTRGSSRSVLTWLQVYMGARDEGRALEAIKQLQADNINDGSVHWLKLDLSDPRAAQRAAQEFLEKEKRLDIIGEFQRISFYPIMLSISVNNAAR
jgi:NAD(P)-dependent dehydrogenase (short-subunit alcohol dehydrogenase family)